jgi:hypothetical protein
VNVKLVTESVALDTGTQVAEPSPLRSRQTRVIRSRSIRVARATKGEIERARRRLEEDENAHLRPHNRSECMNGPRPCPHVSCKHHLYLDVSPYTGTIKLNFPELEVWELSISCALDVADAGGVRLEQVGEMMNITRERARQIEARALHKLSSLSRLLDD